MKHPYWAVCCGIACYEHLKVYPCELFVCGCLPSAAQFSWGFGQMCRWISSMNMSRFRPKVLTVTSMKHTCWGVCMSRFWPTVQMNFFHEAHMLMCVYVKVSTKSMDSYFHEAPLLNVVHVWWGICMSRFWPTVQTDFLHEAHMLRGLFEYLGFDQMCGWISSTSTHTECRTCTCMWCMMRYLYVKVLTKWADRFLPWSTHVDVCVCLGFDQKYGWLLPQRTHTECRTCMWWFWTKVQTVHNDTVSVEADVLTKRTDC